MTLRDDLITVIDDVRTMLDTDLGMRLFTVSTVRRAWDGGAVGRGTYADTTTALAPKPRVRTPSPRQEAAAPGRYESGDRVVDKISATYDEDDLDGGTLATGEEWFWLIDGDPYRVVDKPLKRFLGWEVQLRRMRGVRA